MKSDNFECDQVYEQVVQFSGGTSDVLFRLATCFLSGFNLERLREMLRSEDVGVVLDGLFVCKEIGRLVCEVHECIEPLQRSNDVDVRKMASEVIELCNLYGS